MPTDTWQVLLLLVGSAVAAWLVGVLVGALVRRLGRRLSLAADLSRRGRTPLRALLVLATLSLLLGAGPALGGWRDPVVRVLGLALIATVGWLVAVGVFVVADLAVARYDVDVVDNRHARRVRTQISLLRRLAVVVIGVLAAAAMLLTFPSARAAGASILASAGASRSSPASPPRPRWPTSSPGSSWRSPTPSAWTTTSSSSRTSGVGSRRSP